MAKKPKVIRKRIGRYDVTIIPTAHVYAVARFCGKVVADFRTMGAYRRWAGGLA